MKYAIINTTDCPEPRLVAELIKGKYYYMYRALDKRFKRFDGMTPRRPTAIEDFGFDVIEREFQTDFIKVRESVATYEDGKRRDWQGSIEFSLPHVRLK